MNSVMQGSANPSNQNFVIYGGEKIYYQRLARSEAIRRIKIKVHPDCSVQVLAPKTASIHEVEAVVKLKARWITKKIEGFQEQLVGVTPRQYISGESHYYLGKQYQLKVDVSASDVVGVKLFRGILRVTVREKRAELIRKQLNNWYRIKAREIFNNRIDVLLEQALWVQEKPSMRILAMRSQWGSCSPKGTITLNPMLVKASKDCIDYVILHEFCHLAEHNHSEKFYRLMNKIMPNWEPIKNRLDNMANTFLS